MRRRRFESLEARNLLAAVPFGAKPADTALYAVGEVQVNVVFLESDGTTDTNTEDWTDDHREEVKDNIIAGLEWWEIAYDQTGLTGDLHFNIDFTYADNPVSTQYEPINRKSNDYTLWVDDFLTETGNNTPDGLAADIRALNHASRLENETHWAFTIFVVNSQNDEAVNGEGRFASGGHHSRAFAFAGGLFFVMPSTRPASTVAHETGHMFYAYDEYSGAASYYASRGYLNVQNTNGRTNHPDPTSRVTSIMDAHELAYPQLAISPSAAGMIGWQDANQNGIADVIDAPHTLTGVGSYDPINETYQFSGSSHVNTVPNQNPWDLSLQSDVTLNQISGIEYRLDGTGDWLPISSLSGYSAELSVTIAEIPSDSTLIEIRTIDYFTGVTSNVYTATLDQPGATTLPGVNGFVFHDSNANGQWDTGEEAVEGWTINVLNSFDNPIAPPVVVEADNFDQNEIINHSTPGVTLTAIGFGVREETVRARDRGSVSGDRVFKHYIGSGWSSSWTYGNGIVEEQRQLKIEFGSPVTTVSIDAIANSDYDYGRLEIYDANDNLLGRYTTEELSNDQIETMTLSTGQPIIAYALASGTGNTGVDLDNLQFNADNSFTTGDGGHYAAAWLQPGLYRIEAESRNGYTFTTDSVQQIGLPGGTAIENVNFGVILGAPPWQNQNEPLDVDRSGTITLNDALIVISELRRQGPHLLEGEPGGVSIALIDTNGDGLLTLSDALGIIHHLRTQLNGEGETVAASSAGPNELELISEGEGEEVGFTLEVTNLAGDPVSTVDVGDQFLLNVFVQDLRGDSFLERGIQVAFLDILYDAAPVRAFETPAAEFPIDVTFSPEFQHTPDIFSVAPGLINDAGALQTNPGAALPLGPDPVLLMTIRFEALTGGEVLFQADDADEPGNTVNFFEPPQPAVDQSLVSYGTATLTVVQPLEAIDDSFNVAQNSGQTTFNVRQNDVSSGTFVVESVTSTTSGGSVSVASGGTGVNYTPPANFTGFDAFDYTVRAGSITSTARVQVTIGDPDPPHQNPTNRLDVDARNGVTLNDALLIVADLRANGTHPVVLPTTPATEPPPFLDVTGDNTVSISDALAVIAFLRSQLGGEPESEGESTSEQRESDGGHVNDQVFAEWNHVGIDDDTAAVIASLGSD